MKSRFNLLPEVSYEDKKYLIMKQSDVLATL